jgi:serine/threonine protein kinase
MEYCENGSLYKLLNRTDIILNWNDKLILLYEIANAMNFLHQNNIIHRDLKLDNILITKEIKPKITDFGISRILKDENSNSKTKNVGTSFYIAPEVVLTNYYTLKCDVFSFSIIMYQVLTGKLDNVYNYDKIEKEELSKKNEKIIKDEKIKEENFFDSYEKKKEESQPLLINNEKNSDISIKSVSGYNVELKVANNPYFRPYISDNFLSNLQFSEFIDLMKKCWQHDPKERPSFNEITINLEEINEKLN